jgi:serine/threonine-protein kinase
VATAPLVGSLAVLGAGVDRNIGRLVGGRYRIVGALGRGGMGTVYRAVHTEMSREVAIKMLRPELCVAEEAVRRFEREAEAASKLDHVGCVRVFDFGRVTDVDGGLFLVMELLVGETLAQRLAGAPGKRIAPRTAVHLSVQLCDALAHAHALGIVHRDLKPENVMLVSGDHGERDHVKVLDFGIARVRGGDGRAITESGTVFGTPAYLSPEQALGERADERADVYAIGVMTFEMLAGARPFTGESTSELLAAHLTKDPPRMRGVAPEAGISEELETIVARALAKRRDDRWQRASDLGAALTGARAHDPDSPTGALAVGASGSPPIPLPLATAPLPVPAMSDPQDRHPRISRKILAIAGAALAAVVAVAIVVGRGHDGGDAGAGVRIGAKDRSGVVAEPARSTADEVAAIRKLLSSGDAKTARERATDLARRSPDDAAALLVLGDATFAAGEKSRGLAAYREAARLDVVAAAADPELLANLRASYDDPDHGEAAFALAERIGPAAAPGLRAFTHDTSDPRRAQRARLALSKITPP